MEEIIVFSLLSVAFLAIGAYLIYYYYVNRKKEFDLKLKSQRSGYHETSHKGFWLNNKYNIIIFSGYLFVILGIAFVVISMQYGGII